VKIILFLLFLIPSLLIAQSDSSNFSLTKEFSKLKSKKRIEVAKNESVESESDSVYQKLMLEGDSLFSSKNYILSLERYEQARKRRPLNVYPKIKISDVSPLVKQQITLDSLNLIQESLKLPKEDPKYKEKKFKEGNFSIIERTIISNGHVYRKSIGKNSIYYFLNYKPITKREWDIAFRK